MATGWVVVKDQRMNRRIYVFLGAGAAGLVIWLATMATVADDDSPSTLRMWLLWIAMVAVAAILGYALPEDDGFIAFAMVGAPLVAAGWTAPRGDGDGLWVLIFPYLVVMGFVLWLVAWLAGRLRVWLMRTSDGP